MIAIGLSLLCFGILFAFFAPHNISEVLAAAVGFVILLGIGLMASGAIVWLWRVAP